MNFITINDHGIDREIVPVRLIPFITDYHLGPETLAGILSNNLKTNGFEYDPDCDGIGFDVRNEETGCIERKMIIPQHPDNNVTAYHLDDDKPMPMRPSEWDEFCHELRILKSRLKKVDNQTGVPLSQLAKWRIESTKILPSGVFLWRTELELLWREYRQSFHLVEAYKGVNSDSDDDEFEELNFNAYIRPKTKSIIYDGFEHLIQRKGKKDDHSTVYDEYTLCELAEMSGRDKGHIEKLCEEGLLIATFREERKDLSKDDPFYKDRLLSCVHDWRGKEMLKLNFQTRTIGAIPGHLSPRNWQIVVKKDEWERFLKENPSFYFTDKNLQKTEPAEDSAPPGTAETIQGLEEKEDSCIALDSGTLIFKPVKPEPAEEIEITFPEAESQQEKQAQPMTMEENKALIAVQMIIDKDEYYSRLREWIGKYAASRPQLNDNQLLHELVAIIKIPALAAGIALYPHMAHKTLKEKDAIESFVRRRAFDKVKPKTLRKK